MVVEAKESKAYETTAADNQMTRCCVICRFKVFVVEKLHTVGVKSNKRFRNWVTSIIRHRSFFDGKLALQSYSLTHDAMFWF